MLMAEQFCFDSGTHASGVLMEVNQHARGVRTVNK